MRTVGLVSMPLRGDEDARPTVGPMKPDPAVAVVIPARQSAGSLTATLNAVLRQSPLDEVVIAVGPSTDGTLAVAKDLATTTNVAVSVVENPTGATSAGLNLAIAATDADVIVRVDAHALLPDGYIARALQVMRDEDAANVGGRQVPVAASGFGAAVAAAMRSPVGSGGAAYRHESGGPRDADTVYLGVFDRQALDDVGGYDESMIRNQDAELNLRLKRAGHRVVFCPDLAVDYTPRDTWRGLASQYFQYGRYRRRTVQLHPGSLQARQAAPAALVVALLAAVGTSLVTRRVEPAAVTIGGYLAGLLGAGLASDHLNPIPVATALGTMHLSWGAGFLLGPPHTCMADPARDTP